jgi:Divergent InlB B-repeat domain
MSLPHRPALSNAARLLIGTAALLSIFAFATAPADAAPWSEPEVVATPAGPSSTSEVGTDAAGDATAVWTEVEGSHQVLRAATRPVGSTWGPSVRVSSSLAEVEAPIALAVNENGDAVVAWVDREGPEQFVEVAARSAGGSWSKPEPFVALGEEARNPAVAIDPNGNAVVLWQQTLIGGEQVIESSSRQAGGAWASAEEISSGLGVAETPSVTITATGTVVAGWVVVAGGESHVSGVSKELGGAWTPELAISESSTTTEAPQIEIDVSGEAFIVWSRFEAGFLIAEVARRTPGGFWAQPEPISSGGQSAQGARIAVDPAGDAVAVWRTPEGGGNASLEAATLTGGSWRAPTRISPTGTEIEAPSVAIGPAGVAEVTWSAWNEATHVYESHAAHMGPRGIWKAAIALSHLGKEALGPHVRISRSGHVIVVWVSVEITITIESTEREETVPLAVTKSGDGSGTVTSEPAGIDCGSSCAARFVEGAEVTLKADPAAGSRFAGWSGACAGTGACSLEIGETQAVHAEFVAVGEETGGGGGGGGGSGDSTTTNGASKGAAGPAPHAPTPKGPICTPITAAEVSGFVPKAKPGQIVPGVRAKVSVRRPSTVQVSAMLGFGKGSSIRLADLGSASFHTDGSRNLHFALPKGMRSALPLGSGAHLILSIAARPDAEQGCAQPSTVKRQLAVKVVRVLSGRQAGIN